MKKLLLLLLCGIMSLHAFAVSTDTLALIQQKMDSIAKSFQYQTGGEISMVNGAVKLTVPRGFKYLDAKQSLTVLESLWGNPESIAVEGMLFPEQYSPISDSCWAFVLTYDDMGYVSDKDADEINYDELLTSMQKETETESKEREEKGYESMKLVGWAAKPYYDKEKRVLHWAKELHFGESPDNTLNYNVRVLGRKGVMVLNAVGSMSQLAEVKTQIPAVLPAVSYNEGFRYTDFNVNVDRIAAVGLGGLVAGKMLAKAGILALILKNIKLIILGIFAFGGSVWRFISGRGKEETDDNETNDNSNEA